MNKENKKITIWKKIGFIIGFIIGGVLMFDAILGVYLLTKFLIAKTF